MPHEGATRETRVCQCDEDMGPDEDRCPRCNAQWMGKIKVRKRRRPKFQTAGMGARRTQTDEAYDHRRRTLLRVGATMLSVTLLAVAISAFCALWPAYEAKHDLHTCSTCQGTGRCTDCEGKGVVSKQAADQGDYSGRPGTGPGRSPGP